MYKRKGVRKPCIFRGAALLPTSLPFCRRFVWPMEWWCTALCGQCKGDLIARAGLAAEWRLLRHLAVTRHTVRPRGHLSPRVVPTPSTVFPIAVSLPPGFYSPQIRPRGNLRHPKARSQVQQYRFVLGASIDPSRSERRRRRRSNRFMLSHLGPISHHVAAIVLRHLVRSILVPAHRSVLPNRPPAQHFEAPVTVAAGASGATKIFAGARRFAIT